MAVKPIPEGYPRVSADLLVDGASDAIEFYTSVLGGTERMRMEGPPGRIAHAEVEFGDSLIMLSDESPEMGYIGPKTVGGTPVVINLYVEDVDVTFQAAVAAGAKELRVVQNQFYGDRSGMFEDPWGHHWNVASHVEDVTPEEMEKRMAAMGGGEG